MPRRRTSQPTSDYVRSAFFGFEDSLVSTTGFIAGVSAATHDAKLIIFTGVVAIAVEAFSMAAGEFLSEETTNDLSRRTTSSPVFGGLIMLGSYILAGLVPLLPAVLLPRSIAFVGSIAVAFFGLFLLGYFKGRITRRNPWLSGIKVLFIGGVATVIGVIVALFVKGA